MSANPSICPNCSTYLTGKYCHSCGQKKIEPAEKKIKHFVFQFFGAAFFLENNVLKNCWYLLVRPGYLAHEYLIGRRKSHMAPISLFLLANLIFFFSTNLTDLNLSLREVIWQPQHGNVINDLVEKRLEKRAVTFNDYAKSYNAQSTMLSKSLVVLHAPILAAFLMLVYFRKRYFYVDHFIFALYFMGFILLFASVVINFGNSLARWNIIQSKQVMSFFGYVMLSWMVLYLFFSLRKYYEQKFAWLIPQTILVLLLFGISHFMYRTILFFIVFLTT